MFTIHILLPFRPSIQFSLNQPVNLFNLRTLIFNKTNIPINSQLIVYNNKPLPHHFIIDSNITLVVINKNNYFYQNFNILDIQPYRQLLIYIAIAMSITFFLLS